MAEKANKAQEVKKVPGNAYVTTSFRDKDDFSKEYLTGQDLSGLGEDRLAELVKAGVVSVYQEPIKEDSKKDSDPK